MKFLNNKRIIYILLVLAFIAGVITIFLTHNSFGGGDNFSHYKFAHWGWKYPKLLFNHWGKPVFTILSSPFAQFGIDGARIYNLLMGFGTALIIWNIAQTFKIKNSAISLLFVLATPVYFILMFTTLTEVSFSFFIALGVLLFFKDKYLLSAIVISLLPLVRTEGIILFPLFMIAYGQKKQWLAIPLMTVGFWIISLTGFPFYDDFWWLITKIPYSGNAKDIYGSGTLLHFIYNTKLILGYPLAALFVIGLVYQIIKWFTVEKRQLSQVYFFLLLIPGSYLIFLAAHSFVWWMGIGNSLGLIRVIGSTTPFAALTALVGFNYLHNQIQIRNKIAGIIVTVALLIWIIMLGINTHRYGFGLSPPDKVVSMAANYLKKNKLDKHKIFYTNSQLSISLGLDPFDDSVGREGIPNRQEPTKSMPDSSILVWDAHFGPNEGRLPLDRLLNNTELTLLKVMKPVRPFKVLGGYDYAVYIFQKIPKKIENTDTNNKQSIKEFVFDFEELGNKYDSVSYSGNRSLLLTPKKEYFKLLNHNVSEFTNSISSIKIDFSAALLFYKETNNGEVILVCTLDNDGEIITYQTINLFAQIENSGEWNKLQHTFKINVISTLQDNLKLYIWNKSKTTFNIDEVKIEVTTID